jgi:hypothetical protein
MKVMKKIGNKVRAPKLPFLVLTIDSSFFLEGASPEMISPTIV